MTTVTVADVDIALRRQPLMREFTPTQFDQLMNIAELVDFEPNEVIHREGDESDKLFLVVRGHVAIELAGRLEVLRDVSCAVAEGEVVSPANLNSPGQIVIAGATAAVASCRATAGSCYWRGGSGRRSGMTGPAWANSIKPAYGWHRPAALCSGSMLAARMRGRAVA